MIYNIVLCATLLRNTTCQLPIRSKANQACVVVEYITYRGSKGAVHHVTLQRTRLDQWSKYVKSNIGQVYEDYRTPAEGRLMMLYCDDG